MFIGFFFGRWCWIGSESLGLVLDWSLGPQGCYWIGLGSVRLGLVLDWFWIGSGQEFALKPSSNFLLIMEKSKGDFS